MNKEPFEYNTFRTDDMNDEVLNQFKTDLYELKDNNVELNLNDDGLVKFAQSNNDQLNNLYGNWVIVNGNSIKQAIKAEQSRTVFLNRFSFDLINGNVLLVPLLDRIYSNSKYI